MRTQIPITGISTSSSYKDGDCISLVNLRKKNGALKPVVPMSITHILTQIYDIIILHHIPAGAEIWIGVIHETSTSKVYSNILNTPELITTSEKIIDIKEIGNVLSLITTSGISYLLYSMNKYIDLGEIPDMLPIKLSTQKNPVTFNESYSTDGSLGLWYETEYTLSGINADNFWDSTKGLVNKAITESREQKVNQFTDGFIVRYAYKLYDNSWVKHSPPILVLPEADIFNTILADYRIYNDTVALNSSSHIKINQFCMKMTYDFGALSTWSDIIKSIDIFISPNIGFTSPENILNNKLYLPPTYGERLYTNQPITRTKLTPIFNKVKDISTFYLVKSILPGESTTTVFPQTEEDAQKIVPDVLINQQELNAGDISNHKITSSKQYIYNSRLNLCDIKTTLFKGFNYSFFRWESSYNGIARPQMLVWPNTTTDVTSIKYKIEVQLVIGGSIKKVISDYEGDNYTFFSNPFITYPDVRARKLIIWGKKMYSGGDLCDWVKVNEFVLTTHDFLNVAYYLNTNLIPVKETSLDGTIDLTIDNLDHTKNQIKASSLNNPFEFKSINTYSAGNGTVLNVASNAMRMSDGQFGQYPLYIFTTEGIWTANVGTSDIVYTNITPASNEIAISSIICSTPFGVIFIGKRGLFIINGQQVDLITPQLEQEPADYNVTLPNTTQVPTIAIKSWNDTFREYLTKVTDIIYDNQNNEVIVVTQRSDYPYNVVINLDSKEIYQQTEIIEKVVGNVYPELLAIEKRYVLIDKPYIRKVDLSTDHVYKGVFDIEKNYAGGETVKFGNDYYISTGVNHGTYPYSGGSWALLPGTWIEIQKGVSTLVSVIKEQKPTTDKAEVSILTRPFNFGTPDIKKLDRLILRARLISAENMVVMNHASNDGINFVPVQGQSFSTIGNYKDIDLGLMARNKHRQFVFAMSAKLDEQSEIGFLEAEVSTEYSNEKMR